MSYEELQSKIGSILLIDVRTPPEIEKTGRLPWSYNLPCELNQLMGKHTLSPVKIRESAPIKCFEIFFIVAK